MNRLSPLAWAIIIVKGKKFPFCKIEIQLAVQVINTLFKHGGISPTCLFLESHIFV